MSFKICKMAASSVVAASMDVSFLRRNSEAHEWIFGAIVELIDNSIDAGTSFALLILLVDSSLFQELRHCIFGDRETL